MLRSCNSSSNTEMQEDQGICRNAVLRLDFSATQPCNFADDLLLLEREVSKLKTSWQNLVQELQNFERFVPLHLLTLQFFLSSQVQDIEKISMVWSCVMNVRHSKMFVDRFSNLPSSKKSTLFLEHAALRHKLFFKSAD